MSLCTCGLISIREGICVSLSLFLCIPLCLYLYDYGSLFLYISVSLRPLPFYPFGVSSSRDGPEPVLTRSFPSPGPRLDLVPGIKIEVPHHNESPILSLESLIHLKFSVGGCKISKRYNLMIESKK